MRLSWGLSLLRLSPALSTTRISNLHEYGTHQPLCIAREGHHPQRALTIDGDTIDNLPAESLAKACIVFTWSARGLGHCHTCAFPSDTHLTDQTIYRVEAVSPSHDFAHLQALAKFHRLFDSQPLHALGTSIHPDSRAACERKVATSAL